MFKTILITGLFLMLSVTLYLFYGNNKSKVAYIKSVDLYNEFGLKKELETKLITVKNQRKSILDSLMLQLKMMSTQLEYNEGKDDKEIKLFQIRKQDYLSKEKQFDEDDQRLAEQYSQQIWKQINQYVSDYGKENNYSFIYGASGNGAIMYAQDKYDVTKELTAYINEKYKGEKK